MPKNGTLRKKKRMKARRGLDRATGVADEGGNGTRPPRTALARGPTFADGATSPTRAKWHAPRSGARSATMESSASGSSRADGQTWSAVAT